MQRGARLHGLPRILITLAIAGFLAFIVTQSITYAQRGPAADYVYWKAVPLQNAVQALTSGDIDVYLFGLRPSSAQDLIGVTGITLYQAPAGLVDIGLNPAPVMIVQLPGKVDKAAAAQALGVDPVVISTITYIPADADLNLLNSVPFIGVKINDTDVTIVELCAKPLHSLPANAKVLWQSDKYDINPFCFRQIRFALNYAIDRDYIVKNIYKGLAIAKYAFYGPDDPVYVYLIDIVAKYKFSYNPDLAKSVVTNVLTKAGAQLKGGVWYYNGKPVQVIGIIRVEDERHEIGLMFAHALEQMGIQVIREEVTFSEAIPKVYFTDPRDFEWHFYTEGWGKGALDKWDPWTLAEMAAGWFGWTPGWGEPSYWNYRNYTIDFYSMLTAQMQINADELKQRYYVYYLVWTQIGLISPGETVYVHNKQEWINYLRKGTELGIQESIRIWIVTTTDTYATRDNVQGITLDLRTGLRNPFFYRGVHVSGSDTIKVGHLHVFTSSTIWDPIGGFNDQYSFDPMMATYDPWIWRHPFNGEPIPFRVTFTVQTAGPTGKLQVPSDAIWWDANSHRWVYASQLGRTEATSKVVFDLSKLIGTKWHHGINITWADILGYWAELLDIAYNPAKNSIEGSLAARLQQTFRPIIAIRPLINENKLEVYLDYWHFDPNYIADYAVIAPSVPIEIILAEDYLAFVKKTYALSDERAQQENISRINLVIPEDANNITLALQEIDINNYTSYFTLPDGTRLLDSTEWSNRVAAVQNWVQNHGNAWISDGPFMLVRFDKDNEELELQAFRDPSYPFSASDWVLGVPAPVAINSIHAPPLIEPGKEATIVINATSQYPIHISYVLRDIVTGQVVSSGEANWSITGYAIITFPSTLTSQLRENSPYELIVVAYSDEAAGATEKTVTLYTGTAISRQLNNVLSVIESDIDARTQQILDYIDQEIRAILANITASTNMVLEAIQSLNQTCQAVCQVNVSQPTAPTFNMEWSTVSVSSVPKFVKFAKTYQNPVVVVGPPTYRGNQPAVSYVYKVNSTGFLVGVREWDYLDGVHLAENVSYLVVEAGVHKLSDGRVMEAGYANATTSTWVWVKFPQPFSETPVIVASIASNTSHTVTVRIKDVNATGFWLRLEQEEDEIGVVRVDGLVAWIAIEPGTSDVLRAGYTTIPAGDNPTITISFNNTYTGIPVVLASITTYNGPDPVSLRIVDLTNTLVKIMMQEEQSKDNEVYHIAEQISYIILPPS